MGEQAQHNFASRGLRMKMKPRPDRVRRDRFPGDSWRRLVLLFFVIGCSVLPGSGASAEGTSREYDLKAVLLYNLPQFVEWPATAFAQPDSPVVIGILGRDPFGNVLDDIVRNEKVDGRGIVVRRYRNVQVAVRDCHVLFVSNSEVDNFPQILRVLRGRPVLSVGDFDGFATRGGMVRFMTNAQGKIHLRVNLTATREADLIVSAKLLRVADVIVPVEN